MEMFRHRLKRGEFLNSKVRVAFGFNYLLACVLLLQGCLTLQTIHSPDDSFMPQLKLGLNQNYCEGAIVFDIEYPSEYNGEKHSFTLFQIVSEEKILIESYLAWNPDIPGSHLCLDKKFVDKTRIFVGYGLSDCMSYKYGFSLNSMERIFTEDHLEFDPVDIKSCGDNVLLKPPR